MEQSLENESQQPKKELSKKDVTRSFWRWTFFSHANYNYERLEATGLVHSLSPIIKKLYADDPQEYQNALKDIWPFLIQNRILVELFAAW